MKSLLSDFCQFIGLGTYKIHLLGSIEDCRIIFENSMFMLNFDSLAKNHSQLGELKKVLLNQKGISSFATSKLPSEVKVDVSKFSEVRDLLERINSEQIQVTISPELLLYKEIRGTSDRKVSFYWDQQSESIKYSSNLSYIGSGYFKNGNDFWYAGSVRPEDERFLINDIKGEDIYLFFKNAVPYWEKHINAFSFTIKIYNCFILKIAVEDITNEKIVLDINWIKTPSSLKEIKSLPGRVILGDKILKGTVDPNILKWIGRESGKVMIREEKIPEFIQDSWHIVKDFIDVDSEKLESMHSLIYENCSFFNKISPIKNNGVGKYFAKPYVSCKGFDFDVNDIIRKMNDGIKYIKHPQGWIPKEIFESFDIYKQSRKNILLTQEEVLFKKSNKLKNNNKCKFNSSVLNNTSSSSIEHLHYLINNGFPGGIIGDLIEIERSYYDVFKNLISNNKDIKILVLGTKKNLEKIKNSWQDIVSSTFLGNRADSGKTYDDLGNLVFITPNALKKRQELKNEKWDILCILEMDSVLKTSLSDIFRRLSDSELKRQLVIGQFTSSNFLERNVHENAISGILGIPIHHLHKAYFWSVGIKEEKQFNKVTTTEKLEEKTLQKEKITVDEVESINNVVIELNQNNDKKDLAIESIILSEDKHSKEEEITVAEIELNINEEEDYSSLKLPDKEDLVVESIRLSDDKHNTKKEEITVVEIDVNINDEKEDYSSFALPERESLDTVDKESLEDLTISDGDIGFTISFNIVKREDTFITEAKKYINKKENTAQFVPFMSYWPTYDAMEPSQKKWYFYWRNQVRQNNYVDTDLSYIFVYIYELINNVGVKKPREAYESLLNIWIHYRERFPKLDNYLYDWIIDYGVINKCCNDPLKLCIEYSDKFSLYKYPDIVLTKYIDSSGDTIPLQLLEKINTYKIHRSKFYKEGYREELEEHIPLIIDHLNKTIYKNDKETIFKRYSPPKKVPIKNYPFCSAVYALEKPQEITIAKVYPYSTYDPFLSFMTSVVKYSENKLREKHSFSGRLRGINLEIDLKTIIDKYFELPDKCSLDDIVLNIDTDAITKLKEESARVTSILLDETETIDLIKEQIEEIEQVETCKKDGSQRLVRPEGTPDHLLTDLNPVYDILLRLNSDEISFLKLLMNNNGEMNALEVNSCFENILIENLIDNINEISLKYLGDILVSCESELNIITDDYRDELEYIFELENKGEIAFKAKKELEHNLSEEWVELKSQLEKYHIDVLKALLNDQDNISECLCNIAEENFSMPELLLDEINDIAMDSIGDIIIDTSCENPIIEEEDLEDVKTVVKILDRG